MKTASCSPLPSVPKPAGPTVAECKALYRRGLFVAQAIEDIEAQLNGRTPEEFRRLPRLTQHFILRDLRYVEASAHAVQARLKFTPLKRG